MTEKRKPRGPKPKPSAEQLANEAHAEARSRADFERRQMPLPGIDGKPLCWWQDPKWGTRKP